MAKIIATCISEAKGLQKHPVEQVELQADWGIVDDAHAGDWHRQVSLLGQESVDKLQNTIAMQLKPGTLRKISWWKESFCMSFRLAHCCVSALRWAR